jgi:glycosyltransferase involved in cell wall biosynthesis
MRALVSASARFYLTPDGTLWTPNASLGYATSLRYLDAYDEVELFVRSRHVDEPQPGWVAATGPGVIARPAPDFGGLRSMTARYQAVRRAVQAAVASAEAIQLRVPCPLGTEVWRAIRGRRPYGLEVVGDPYDVFAPGVVRHPLRPLLRSILARQLRQQCAGATAVAYVTEHTLQQRYPCPAYTTNYSSIELRTEGYVAQPRAHREVVGPLTIVTVGTLAQRYKGHDVLIDAVDICIRRGLNLRLVIVGDGRFRPELEARVCTRQLEDHVVFTGHLSSADAVRNELDAADLYVSASRTEGLSRAVIEAMARGLPCIATAVGGNVELLDSAFLVPPDDPEALAAAIRRVCADPGLMADMSAQNLARAQAYRASELRVRRRAFYTYMREQTEAWQHTCSR